MQIFRYIGWRAILVATIVVGVELGMRHWTNYGKWIYLDRSAKYGWVHLTDQVGWTRHYEKQIRINDYGFRDREWELPAKDDEGNWVKDERYFRVAVVGNSMTYGTMVDIENVFTRVLEDKLRESFEARGIDKQPLVMNFATQGYVFEQMALIYEDKIRPFKPDMLIVPLIPHDVMPFVAGGGPPSFPYRTEIVRTATHDYLFRKWMHPWQEDLKLAQKKLDSGEIFDPEDTWGTTRSRAAEIKRLDDRFKKTPYGPGMNEIWEADFERKEEVLEMVEADGGKMVLVGLPLLWPMLNTERKTVEVKYRPWARDMGVRDGQRRVILIDCYPEAKAHMQNLIRVINERNMEGQLQQGTETGYYPPGFPYREENLYLPTDNGHYNEAGHRLVAEKIFRELEKYRAFP